MVLVVLVLLQRVDPAKVSHFVQVSQDTFEDWVEALEHPQLLLEPDNLRHLVSDHFGPSGDALRTNSG